MPKPEPASTPAYDALVETFGKLHRLAHVDAIVQWDSATYMPPAANAARTDALAELATVVHRLRTDPRMKEWLARSADEPLSDFQRASLREMARNWRRANALPEALVERRQQATGRCEHAWRDQRPLNDWSGFLANFREVVAIAREEAQWLADDTGLSRYDALMDGYEPDMRSAQLDELFGDLKSWLPDLISRGVERQATRSIDEPSGPFSLAGQRQLCEQVMTLLAFDFSAGRLDESTHPFCGGVPEDVRMTTRFSTGQFLGSLLGTIHETGHGRYEQSRPRQWLGLPVGEARSMAIHESQSLFFEMQLAGHPGFAKQLAPLIRKHLGDQEAFSPDNLNRLLTRVEPGLIRVEADELTYPAHVILRYEIERPLIEGDIEAEDIPSLWDAKMQELLGLDTRGNFKDGPMQDIHWPMGSFGYFPCYSLGAMYAAQWAAAMRRELPFDALIADGNLAPIFAWLNERIWQSASLFETDALVQRASGEALNPAHYRAHLTARYLA
jgi:carboxypeptidase Taq